MKTFVKDPGDVEFYTFNYAGPADEGGPWLEDGDTIVSYSVTVTGVTLVQDSNDDTTVTVKLSGGTVGEPAQAVCHVVTTAGRLNDRTIVLQIKNR